MVGSLTSHLPAAAQVPAVLLVARNSTDTAYFQRLRPYPRVLLRRSHTRFKDYVALLRLVAVLCHGLSCVTDCYFDLLGAALMLTVMRGSHDSGRWS